MNPARGVIADVEQHDDALVLVVVGDIDALTAPEVAKAVDDALGKQPAVLIVDLSNVDFLASAGLAVLVETHRKAGDSTRFRVVATRPSTRRPLEITGLTDELAVFASRDDALAV